MKKIILFALLLSCFSGIGLAQKSDVQARIVQDFDNGWMFQLNGEGDFVSPTFDDSGWRKLNLPHDWAVEGDFSRSNPSGTVGGALPGGTGWYRKSFEMPAGSDGKCIYIQFDGIYMNSEVYLNGHLLGKRPYGYISFEYEMTPYLQKGKNVLAVKVDNSLQPNTRWYSGCGIYRNVWFKILDPVHIANWGTYVTTPQIEAAQAKVQLVATIENKSNHNAAVEITSRIVDAKGKVCATATGQCSLQAGGRGEQTQDFTLASPTLWTLEKPYLYTVVTELKSEGRTIDRYTTPLGVRSFKFDAKTGFSLNGKRVKLNGVCNHHDLGCLGSAINKRAIERQLQILKEMGCNAIRTSHNPPAPELLDLCDRMGFLVMDEDFDMWLRRKTRYDYANFFAEWYERDITNWMLRDRNHPCIILWSIGNEVLEQWSDASSDTLTLEQANLALNFGQSPDMLARDNGMSVNSMLTRKMANMVRSFDSTRPVTAACNEPSPGNHLFKSGALDVIGINYHNPEVKQVPKNFAGKPFIISESVSGLKTRGYYRMPSDSLYIWPQRWDIPLTDTTYSCSSYDNCHVPWGVMHEENVKMVRDSDYISGQFIWTGFDYLGEPTPFPWPARSSYFGIIDLAGFPKDVYYMYKSAWTDDTVLHLFPHWNWTPGQDIDLWVYCNHADEVELFVNGVSQGTKAVTKNDLHQWWRVKFAPGSIKAVSRKGGKVVAQKEIFTAGEPAALRLTPDRKRLSADGKDLSFVTVEVVDKDGNLCPNADNLVNFTVSGNVTIAGVDNGSPISMERFKDNKRKAFYGKCLVVLQNNGKAGNGGLKATSAGLKECTLSITAK